MTISEQLRLYVPEIRNGCGDIEIAECVALAADELERTSASRIAIENAALERAAVMCDVARARGIDAASVLDSEYCGGIAECATQLANGIRALKQVEPVVGQQLTTEAAQDDVCLESDDAIALARHYCASVPVQPVTQVTDQAKDDESLHVLLETILTAMDRAAMPFVYMQLVDRAGKAAIAASKEKK